MWTFTPYTLGLRLILYSKVKKEVKSAVKCVKAALTPAGKSNELQRNGDSAQDVEQPCDKTANETVLVKEKMCERTKNSALVREAVNQPLSWQKNIALRFQISLG